MATSTGSLVGTSVGRIGLYLFPILVMQGCGGSLPAGAVGSSCSSDAACGSGLVCLSEICVQPAAAGAGGGAGSGGVGGGAGAAGAAGGAGGAGARPCTPSTTVPAPAGGLIADFMGPDGGVNLGGGFFAYSSSGPGAPVISTAGGILHVTEDQVAMSAVQYVGAGLYFNNCIDATAFTGVAFSISGAMSGCSMQFATGDVEHQDPSTTPGFATGPAGGYPPQTPIPAGDVTVSPQVVKVPFAGTTIPGNPATPLDPQKEIFVFWQFTIPAATATPADGAPASCTADLTIDDVTFY
jgi:hypothetical protein